MAKIKEEDLRLNVVVNGDSGRKRILDLEKTIQDSNTSIKEMRKEMSMLAKEGQTNSARYKELSTSIKEETASVKQNKAQLEDLRSKLSLNSMTIGELSKRVRDLKRDLNNVTPGTTEWERLNTELRATAERLRQLKGESSGSKSSIAGLTGSVGKMTAGFGAAFIAVKKLFSTVSGAFNTIKDFEQANVNLSTILGQEVGTIFDLTNQARELGSTTRYTASEVTGLQTELAKLGFTQREILQMTGSVLNFATAIGAELPESAALAGATLRMFGLQASQTDDVMGTLALSTNKSALNFSYLQTAMSIVGPVARTFGFSVKDTTSLLGTLANAGFDASSAATATRNIILNLANANGKLAKALGEPVHTFPELIDGLKKLNDKGVDLATTLELTDKRSVAAFNAFLSGADSAKLLREELEDTGGVLQEIADKRMNTVEGSIASLKSAWEGFVLSLSNSKGVIKDTIDLLADLVRKITPGEDIDPGATAKRTGSYVGSLWNMYSGQENGMDLILNAISEDEKKMEQGLKNAEAKLESASGILAKRRAKKELQYYQEGMAVMAGARKELSDRQSWESGGSPGGPPTPPPTPPGGGGGSGNEKNKSWSLSNDIAFLAAKAELTRRYNEGEIESQKEYDEQLYQIEISALNGRLASQKDSATDRQKIEAELQDKILKHKQAAVKEEAELRKKQEALAAEGRKIVEEEELAAMKAADKKLAAEVKRYEEEKTKFQGHKETLEAIEKKHRRNMMQIRIEAENDAFKNLQTRHDLERQQLENQWMERIAIARKGSGAEAELVKGKAMELANLDLVYLESLKSTLETITKVGEFDGVKLDDEQLQEYQKKLADVIKQILSIKNETKAEGQGITYGSANASFWGVSIKDWDLLIEHAREAKMTADELANAITGIGSAAQEGFKLANQAIKLTNANEKKALDDYKKGQESKKKSLEDRYKAGLMTESQYNDEVEQMEADMKAKQEAMELEQAQRAQKIAIVESIINTFLAASKALAQGGMPAGPIMAGIITALGVAQTAMIADQPVGYAEGGEMEVKRAQDGRAFRAKVDPKRRGYVDRPTVLVAEEGPEYVISAEALKNPDIRAYADTIESARRTGRLRSLRLEAVNPAAAVTGRAVGGYMQDAAPSGTAAVSTETAQEIGRLRETVDRLSTILDAGIEAEVVMTGRKGLVRRFEEYNRMKNRGQL